MQSLGWYILAKKAGYRTAELDAIIGDLKKGLKPEQMEKAEEMVPPRRKGNHI